MSSGGSSNMRSTTLKHLPASQPCLFPSALDDSVVPVPSRHRRTWPSPCPGQGIAPVCEPWDNLTRVAARLSPLECIMAPIDDVAVYDDLLDLLAESADAERVLA